MRSSVSPAVVEAVRAGKRIGFLVGAGISVACGIPDFRSPNGFYATLKADSLTCTPEQLAWIKRDPSMCVSWHVFQNNQLVYHEVRKPFILGLYEKRWKPSLVHFFQRLLQDKGQLTMVYSQNIDGLDLSAGVERTVAVHGSILRAECEFCGAEYPFDKFADQIKAKIKNIYDPSDPNSPKESSEIPCLQCKKPGVKPATVLFGRSLPAQYFEAQKQHAEELDVLFILGTSLCVSPANLLPLSVREDCLRVVINRDPVGADIGIGMSARDSFVQGDCDDGVISILKELGWLKEMNDKYGNLMCENSRKKLSDALN